jgi:hypothetical protein
MEYSKRDIFIGIVAAFVVNAFSSLALAAPAWDFSVCNGTTSLPGTAAGTQSGSGAVGNSYACAANGSVTRDLTVSAWGAVSSSNTTFGTAFVASQGTDGFGVGSQSEGGAGATGLNTSVDNDPTTLSPNLLLLHFGSAVVLDTVTLGASFNDADVTLMAYTGALPPSSFLAGKTSTNLTAGGAGAGWSLVQNLGDGAPDASYGASGTNIDYSVNPGGVSSSYWLISAYDPGFGGGTLDSLVDYFDVLGVATRDAAEVPEPGALVLALSALAMLSSQRRKVPPQRFPAAAG